MRSYVFLALLAFVLSGCICTPHGCGPYQHHAAAHHQHAGPRHYVPGRRYSEQMHRMVDEHGMDYLMPHSAFVPFVNPLP